MLWSYTLTECWRGYLEDDLFPPLPEERGIDYSGIELEEE